jgi:Tol biopolymer transport system component
MKARRVIATAMVLTLTWAAAANAQQTAEELYQAALYQEEVKGDLERAIQLYRDIVERHGDARAVAAKALLHLGNCYEKLGRTEATNAYQRLLNDYADQSEAAAEARARLTALQRAIRAAEEVGITTRLVWSGPNASADGPAPDGKYFVWSDGQKTGNLAVREVATGKSRYLTEDATYAEPWAFSYGGRVSPDGEWVAHGYSQQDQGGSLRVVGTDGENVRELLREKGCWVHPYEWMSDGKHVAARWSCWSEANPQGTFEIVMVSVGDGSAQVVHELPSARYGLRASLSSDDRYLVYDGPVDQDDGNYDVWLLPLDGGDVVPLIQHPAKDHLLGWVPGTDQVLFLSDRDGTWDLWAASIRGEAIVGPPRKLQRDMGEVSAAGFSESGSFFYKVFTRWFTTSISPFDLAAGAVNLEAATPLLGSNRDPHWAPDAQYLAFITESPSLTSGKLGRINIRHLTTGEQRELASHLRARFLEEWSPDGRAILVIGMDDTQEDRKYRYGIFAVDVASEEVTRLVSLPEGIALQQLSAEWSHDGEAIIYSVTGEQQLGRLVRRELASGEESELYQDSLLIPSLLKVAPGGRHAVVSVRDPHSATEGGSLAVLDLETGYKRPIFAAGDSVSYLGFTSVSWTPDGEYILYSVPIQGDEWRTHVWRVAAAGGDPEYLWTVGEGKWGSWFELSPDGRQIALTTYTQENEVWVMDNLKEVLEREP